MDRYNVISNKNKREIVLLRSFPCVWGKCSFCDYIEDNSTNEKEIDQLNKDVLKSVTGIYGVLEVINSGSVFELPQKTLEYIRDIVKTKEIKKLYFESHWCYRNRLDEMRDYMGIPIVFKTGIETFDDGFRNNVLNKNIKYDSIEEIKKYFDSVCLMVGIKGQTKEMIRKDMDILINEFPKGTVNIWNENTTRFKRDKSLIKWFEEEYNYLKNNEDIEVLFENTDFGVGD